jgi:hypothetical protein
MHTPHEIAITTYERELEVDGQLCVGGLAPDGLGKVQRYGLRFAQGRPLDRVRLFIYRIEHHIALVLDQRQQVRFGL